MDNDQAPLREGVQLTYKICKGFQPLQLTCGPFVIDAMLWGGAKYGNAGDMAGKAVNWAVRFPLKHYRPDVPSVVATDSGFFLQ